MKKDIVTLLKIWGAGLSVGVLFLISLSGCENKSEAGMYMYNVETESGREYDAVSEIPVAVGDTVGYDSYGFLVPKGSGMGNVIVTSKRYL